MWFFNRNKQEKTLTDDMRTKSLETRRLQHQIQQLEKQVEMKAQLGTLQEMLNGGSNKGEEAMLMMLMQMFMSPQNKTQPNQAIVETNPLVNSKKTSTIARFLSDKIPDNLVPELQNLTDNEMIAIKNEVLKIKAGV